MQIAARNQASPKTVTGLTRSQASALVEHTVRQSRSVVALFVFALLTASSAGASSPQEQDDRSDSRIEELKERRRQKLANPVPAEPNRAEEMLLKLEKGQVDRWVGIRFKDFYPQFGGGHPGAGFGGGVRYFKSNIRKSGMSVEAAGMLSTRGYKFADFQVGRFNKTDPVFFSGPSDFGVPFDFARERPGVQPRKAVLFADLRYRNLPQERFWGLGSDTDDEDRSNFLLQDSSFSLIGGYQFTSWFAASVGAGFHQVNLDRGTDERFPVTQDVHTEETAPGLSRQPNFYRIASAVYFNYQDNPMNPHKGGIIGVFYFRGDEIGGREFQFNRYAVDARHFIPLGSIQRVLAVRVYTSVDRADEGSVVPFYMHPSLGGGQSLRGFRDFRFRDANLMYLSAEYRWEAAPALEFALFYDTGRAFPEGESFSFRHLRKNVGFGVRLKSSQGVMMRFDIAQGDEGTRLQFKFGHAF